MWFLERIPFKTWILVGRSCVLRVLNFAIQENVCLVLYSKCLKDNALWNYWCLLIYLFNIDFITPMYFMFVAIVFWSDFFILSSVFYLVMWKMLILEAVWKRHDKNHRHSGDTSPVTACPTTLLLKAATSLAARYKTKGSSGFMPLALPNWSQVPWKDKQGSETSQLG